MRKNRASRAEKKSVSARYEKKVVGLGNAYYVNIPKAFAYANGIEKGSTVRVETDLKSVTIRRKEHEKET